MQPGAAGRLERDRIERAARIVADPALDEALALLPLAPRRAEERAAVEPPVIGVGEEVRRGARRALRIERDDDCPGGGGDLDTDDAGRDAGVDINNSRQ